MNFKIWLESEDSEQEVTAAPASAEVLRTGLQPQVDAEESHTKQKEEQDKVGAIDSYMQRIIHLTQDMDVGASEKLTKMKKICRRFKDEWEDFKNGPPDDRKPGGLGGYRPPVKQLQFMQDNQPLPSDSVNGYTSFGV